MSELITVKVEINQSIEKVWNCFTNPSHIIKWNFASPDWQCPTAQNDLRVGGKFVFRMAAKDGSSGFDFNGIYTAVSDLQLIEYTIEGGRKVQIRFEKIDSNTTQIIEIFEAENVYSLEKQQFGWQSILNNFKKHCEST